MATNTPNATIPAELRPVVAAAAKNLSTHLYGLMITHNVGRRGGSG